VIHRIESASDSALETYRHVGDPRWLAARGLFVCEGRLLLERLVATGFAAIDSVLVSPAAFDALAVPLQGSAAPVLVAPQTILEEVTGFNFHRGCLAIALRPETATLEQVLGARVVLALEGVGNPDNVGGLFRTAAALGAGGVLIDGRTGDPLYRKALRTSMGATFRLPFARVASMAGAVRELRARGVVTIAMTPRAGAAPLDDVVSRAPAGTQIVVLVGSEGGGLSDDVLAAADVAARIPIEREVDSLNVVVAAGIALSRMRAIRS
jgi:tRNA G18 (ribose-2'-O)-methylase SpoU